MSEQQQELASLYALGALEGPQREQFERDIRANPNLRALVRDFQRAAERLALASPQTSPRKELRSNVLERIQAMEKDAAQSQPAPPIPAGFAFVHANDKRGWKPLPIPGAFIKLLSLEPARGYAVLLGKLEPGVRYPAHVNMGPEDFYILTGDLHVGAKKLEAGDFHHADAGSKHEVNYSLEGCTLLAVLTTDDPLVAFAMS